MRNWKPASDAGSVLLEVMNWKPASDAGSVFESVHLTSAPACCDAS